MTRMKKVGTILFGIAAAGIIGWAMLYQSGTIGGGDRIVPGSRPVDPVDGNLPWRTLTPVEIPVFYAAIGTVRSREEIVAISRLPAARIIEVHFRSGDAVKKGEVLIRLEDDDLKSQVDVAEENLKGAESRLKFAESEYVRYEKLLEFNAVSRRVFEESQSVRSAARAEVAMLKHQLDTAKTNLGFATIRSPFDGIVAERNCDPGDLATPLNPLLKLFNPAKLQFSIPIRENLFRAIRIGERLTAKVAATGRDYDAEIREIVPAVDPGSRTFVINAYLDGETSGLMPGMFARCDVPTGKRTALLVPAAAIVRIGQLEYLPVRGADGAPVRQLVNTVPGPDAATREIISGARAADQYLEKMP